MIDSHAHLLTGGPRWAETLEDQLANVPAGGHVCPLYDTLDEHAHALIPFLRAGIARGEQCLYIGDTVSSDELVAHGVATEADRKRGALVALPAHDTYLRDGRFDPDAMLERWRVWQTASQAQGFAGLRVSGSASWALDTEMNFDGFIEYEARLTDFLTATGSRAMCQYDFGRFQAEIIRNVLRTHPLAIVGDHLYENVYFEPPAVVLGGANAERQRVEWMRTRLRSRAQREMVLADLGRLALAGASPADLMRAVSVFIATDLQADAVDMLELLLASNELRLVASAGARPGALGRTEPIEADGPLASGDLRAGHPLIIPDWSQETRFRQSTVDLAAGITSSATVIISIGPEERIYGILRVNTNESRIFSEEEIVFLEAVAIALAHALARKRGEDEFRALVEHTPDVIARFDYELRITYVNPALERVTGRPADSLLGKNSREAGMLESFIAAWELALRQTLRSGREHTTEYSLSTPQGERRFQSRIVPEFSPSVGGFVESLLVVSRDITELKRAEAERKELSAELLKAERAQKELLERQVLDQQKEIQRLSRGVLQQLTPREREILWLVAKGWTNRDIGRELHLSPGTVKNHIPNLLTKLNATDRTQAAAIAAALGLVNVVE